jgi:hypothetical protein
LIEDQEEIVGFASLCAEILFINRKLLFLRGHRPRITKMEDQANRAHRPSKEKKKYSGANPKAFAFSNPGKGGRQAARSHDIKEKRLHVPLVDRLPEEAPPLVVAVVGPPGVSYSA